MKIAAVASALPVHVYPQATLARYLCDEVWRERPAVARRLGTLHEHVRVERRHLALPIERYALLRTFDDFNDAWIEAGTELAAQALAAALARAGLSPRDVDVVLLTTVTGVASPSLDARVAQRAGLRPDVKRLPLFGLGCVAGASLLARAADLVRGEPRAVVAALSVELCSLTLQRDDESVANLIATGLFGDGAACAIVVGAGRAAAGPAIVDSRANLYPDTESAMGWRVGAHGLRIVLSPDVPRLAREHLGADVDALLARHRLARGDVAAWLLHPGGPKVLEAARDALCLADADVELAWESLARAGNLSSASVLLILEATLARRPPPAGAWGVLAAMGPGFCSEAVLLRW